jgi:Raf kinase inhibitor-like YbhB/YbcL family protein
MRIVTHAMPAVRRGLSLRVAILAAALLVLLGGTVRATDGEKEGSMTMQLTSAAFVDNGSIPVDHTCDGRDISPPLVWSGLPEGTKSMALIMDDPDAPDPQAPKVTWVHWVLYNLPPDVNGLPEGVRSDELPSGTQEGVNDWKRVGYGGACPPIGRHRYFHKLYALDTLLPDLGHATKADVEAAMEGHVLARAELVGTYERSR